jgi:hypothetical protein
MAESSLLIRANELVRTGREVELRRLDRIEVLCLVDTSAPRSLVLPIRDAFDPRLPGATVRVCALGEEGDLYARLPDVCVCVQGSQADAAALAACQLAIARVPVALVVESSLDVLDLPLDERERSYVSVLPASSEEVLLDRLAEWLLSSTDKDVACAANFPFCRRAKANQVIADFAHQSASEAMLLGPRAELPSMTDRHVRLALALAAINGEPLALGRVPEVAAATFAGIGSRAMANKGLGRLPLVGWLFKVGFGYLGTEAAGRTLQRHYDRREMRVRDGVEEDDVLVRAARMASSLVHGLADARRAARADAKRPPALGPARQHAADRGEEER